MPKAGPHIQCEILAVFFVSAFVYLGCAAGYIDTIDADPSIETAKSLIERGSLAVSVIDPNPVLYQRGQDGFYYSKLGWASAIAYIPFVLLAKTHLFLAGGNAFLVTGFYCSLLNSILTASILSLIYFFFRLLPVPRKECIWICMSVGLATSLFPYSKSAQRETLQALCLLGTFVFPYHADKFKKRKWAFLLGGLSAGFAILTKQVLFFCILPGTLYVFLTNKNRKETPYFFFPLLLGLGLYFGLSKSIFGSWFSGGYGKAVIRTGGGRWSTPVLEGLHAQITSSKTGLIFFNPIVLILAGGVLTKIFWLKRWSLFDWAVTATICIQLLIHARWYSPTGEYSLGPRYVINTIPLWFLLIAQLPFPPKTIAKSGFVLLICIGLQLIHVSVKPQQYWELKSQFNTPDFPHQWLTHSRIFMHKLQGLPEKYDARSLSLSTISNVQVDLTGIQSFQGLNFWWAHYVRWLERAP